MNIAKPVFERHKTLDELSAAVKAEGWELNTLYFDRGESDHVTFKFTVGQTAGECFFSTVNGQIFGEFWGVKAASLKQPFHSQVGTHDNHRWFQKLLAVCLVEQPAKNVQAFGYKAQIELANGRTIWRHWRVKQASEARHRAGLVAGAVKTLECLPLTEVQWHALFGET